MLSTKREHTKFAGSFPCAESSEDRRVMAIVSEGTKESLSDWISVWRSCITYIYVWGLGNTDPGRVKEYRRSL